MEQQVPPGPGKTPVTTRPAARTETRTRTRTEIPEAALLESRRRFLASCGRLAVATPPGIVMLLSAAEQNFATAFSGSTRTRRLAAPGHTIDHTLRCDEALWKGSDRAGRIPVHCDEALRIGPVRAEARIESVRADR